MNDPPARDKLVLTAADLSAPAVDQTLAELKAVRGTRDHYEQADAVAAPPPPAGWAAWLRKAAVYLPLAGLLGALLGFAVGEVAGRRPTEERVGTALVAAWRALPTQIGDPALLEQARRGLRADAGDNPYFATYVDPALSDAEKDARTAALLERDRWGAFKADALLFAVAGATIGLALAAAERAVDRNLPGALVDGAVGALVGAAGGLGVAFAAPHVRRALLGGVGDDPSDVLRVASAAAVWGMLGLTLAIAPGVLMRSPRRLLVGLVGSALGGAVGGVVGVLIDPSGALGWPGRLAALVLIGAGAGLALALVEAAAKQGWLLVTRGPIAGKQFVLYRDPTYVGAAPTSHVYLFRDAAVGRRHAQLRRAASGTGWEIENLPLGGPTLVNGAAVAKARLRHGDRVGVGRTEFVYQERKPSAR